MAANNDRYFPDDEDHEAFGHWDRGDMAAIRRIKNPKESTFDVEGMRRVNSRGVPNFNVAACRKLGQYMHSKRLPCLSLANMVLDVEHIQALINPPLAKKGKRSRTKRGMKKLDLSKNHGISSDDFVAVPSALSKNTKLHDLRLSDVRLGYKYVEGRDSANRVDYKIVPAMEKVRNFVPSLSAQTCLKSLDLSNNGLDNEGMKMISGALSASTSRNLILHLPGNKISQYSSIAPLLKSGEVRDLNLDSNPIDDSFLIDMQTDLGMCGCMESLSLRRNRQISYEGYQALLEAIIYTSSSIGDAMNSNHSLTNVNEGEMSRHDILKMLYIAGFYKVLRINGLNLSVAEKGWRKVIGYLFDTDLNQSILDIDIKLMPYMLSKIGGPTKHGFSFNTDYHRYKIMYNMVRNWNMPSLFHCLSLDRQRIYALEDENKNLKNEIVVLKRKAEDYDELGKENKRLREELQRLKDGFVQKK